MHAQLEDRLRAVYAKGYLELTDVDQCDFSYLDPLEAMLQARLAPWGVGLDKFCVWSQLERVASTSISLWAADRVPWKSGNTQLQQRLAETGQPGVVCILTVSTVYPAWDCYFNVDTTRRPERDFTVGRSSSLRPAGGSGCATDLEQHRASDRRMLRRAGAGASGQSGASGGGALRHRVDVE